MITAAQCRAARGMLNLTQAELAQMIGRGVSSIKRFEDAGYGASAMSRLMEAFVGDAIQKALEERGIVFISTPEIGRYGIEGPE